MFFATWFSALALIFTLAIFDTLPPHATAAMHFASVVGPLMIWGMVAKVWRDVWTDCQKTKK